MQNTNVESDLREKGVGFCWELHNMNIYNCPVTQSLFISLKSTCEVMCLLASQLSGRWNREKPELKSHGDYFHPLQYFCWILKRKGGTPTFFLSADHGWSSLKYNENLSILIKSVSSKICQSLKCLLRVPLKHVIFFI